jgi:ATP-dependent RNA helicase DDX51/DBP6
MKRGVKGTVTSKRLGNTVLDYGNFVDWHLLLCLITAVGKEEAVRGDFIGKFTTPAELSEHVCVVTPESKPLVLYHMITSNSWQHVLVFVGSRKDAHRLSLLLSNLGQMSFRVAEISSSLSRLAREKVLAKFSTGKIDV